ncbi:MAG: hypothetical protein ACQSGP_20705, partial [Frankia sp.]
MQLSDMVLASAGGSLLPDEAKGDYAQALRIAGDGLRATRGSTDPPQRADALLAAGLAALLAGSPGLAERRLRDAAALPGPPELKALASTLAHLAFLNRWFLLPGGGSNILLTDCRWRADVLSEVAAAGQRRAADLNAAPNVGVACVQSLIYDVLFAAGSVLGSDFVTGRLIDPGPPDRLAAEVE